MNTSKFNWQGKSVLVTGAAGFIGSHLVEALVKQGAKVRANVLYSSLGRLDWLEDMPKDIYKEIEVMQGDIRDADLVNKAVSKQDMVFHLGAIISIPYSYVNPGEVAAVNVNGTLNILNACRQYGVQKMIHTSTSEVYGSAQYVPIDEKHPLVGQSPYSASKIGADKLVESFYQSFNLPTVTVRPFNTYGPRQSARAVIPTIIVQILNKAQIKLGTLSTTRDFTYVADTVTGFIKAAESDKTNGTTFNLGTNSEISIGDLVKKIGKITNTTPEVISEQERIRPKNSEVQRLWSNNALVKELTSWAPEHSIDAGLEKTIDWLKKNLSYYERAQREYII